MSTARKTTNNFINDERGLIGPIFGLMAIPLLAAAGAAIDYGKAVSHKTELQQALDRATIAVCTRGDREAEEVMRSHLDASLAQFGGSLQNAEGTGGTIELRDATPNAVGVANPKLSSSVETSLLKFVNIPSFDIEVESGVACGSKRLELALMLDVTGSMCWTGPTSNGNNSCNASSTGNKLHSMKQAVDDVLDIFRPNMEAGKTKIGLVPFSETVNVGDLADQVRGNIPSGTSQWPGKQHYQFPKNGQWRTHKISDCVTEREGTEAYTNAPPSTAWVGLNYPSSNGNCKPTVEITPLTSDRQKLHDAVWNYSGQGGTAGHLGTAWAWYLVSPDWAYLWPDSGVEPKDEQELVKAVILMTDGDFNTQYCEGVKDNENGWCNAANSSKTQAAALCTAMKADGVQVYTVGFQVPGASDTNPSSQQQLLMDCASDDAKYFFPYDGDALRLAFQSIGKQLAAGQIGKAVIQN